MFETPPTLHCDPFQVRTSPSNTERRSFLSRSQLPNSCHAAILALEHLPSNFILYARLFRHFYLATRSTIWDKGQQNSAVGEARGSSHALLAGVWDLLITIAVLVSPSPQDQSPCQQLSHLSQPRWLRPSPSLAQVLSHPSQHWLLRLILLLRPSEDPPQPHRGPHRPMLLSYLAKMRQGRRSLPMGNAHPIRTLFHPIYPLYTFFPTFSLFSLHPSPCCYCCHRSCIIHPPISRLPTHLLTRSLLTRPIEYAMAHPRL